MTTILVSLIIGGTAGLLAGMFGIGGGIVGACQGFSGLFLRDFRP